jgi:hypothetical protein
MLKCVCPGCNILELTPEDARVPSLAAIREKTRRQVTVEGLAEHALCKKHGAIARRHGVQTFPYLATVRLLEERELARREAAGFFQVYSVAKGAEQMRREPVRG